MISTVLIHVVRWATCTPTLGTAARVGPTAGDPPSCWPRSRRRPKQLYCSQIKIFCADCMRGKYRKYQPGELWSQKIPSAEKMDWKLRKMFRLLFRCGRCSAQPHIIMWNTHLAKVIFEVLTSNVESEVTKAQGILDWIEYLLDFGQKEQKDWPRGDRMGNVLTTYLMIVPRPTQLDIISIL